MVERIGKVKAQELMDLDKGNLLGEAKAAHASKGKEGIHLLFPIGRQVFRLFQASKAHHV